MNINNSTIKELFEKYAIKKPKRTAFVYKNKKFNFKTLNFFSDYIAKEIVTPKIEKGDIIAVLLNRSPEMIYSILAIHKIGACCLIIDKKNDLKENRSVLVRAKAKLIITDIYNQNLSDFKVHLLNLKKDFTQKYSKNNIKHKIKPEDNAFIFFTSGSTGESKGVLLSHKSIINGAYSWIKEGKITSRDRFALSMSVSAIPFVFNMCIPLFLGGSFVFYQNEDINDYNKLFSKIKKDKVTILELSIAFLSSCLNAKKKIDLSTLRILVTGGEKIFIGTVKNFLKRYPNILLACIYGCTEYSSISIKVYSPKNRIKRITEGRVVINTEVLILDNKMKKVKNGQIGKLYVSGDSLLTGYIEKKYNRKNFYNYNFLDKKIKYFKTGDCARFLNNNEIEILGRDDDIVQVRGNNVNIKYVEGVIMEDEKVKEAVVLLKRNKGSNYLEAYCVFKKNKGKNNEKNILNLKNTLYEKMPSFAIPDYFFIIKNIPLNRNGKIDKRKIGELKQTKSIKKFNGKLNFLEKEILSIWEDVFGINLNLEDDFFILGGNSLKAIQIISRINEKFKINISPFDIIKNKNVERLSKFIQKKYKK